jgi:pyruvate dehydrogenase E2 component (dihydrolipoamide acetyltransferase)
MVSHMTTTSWHNIPHVCYLYEPDITDFYDEYKKLAKDKEKNGNKISFNTIMIKTIVEGLKAAPELNALIKYNHKKGEGTVQICSDINISLPWLLPDGRMITPVISNVESKDLVDISKSIAEMGKKIANTNVDELLYRAVVTDTLKELGSFHLGIFKRILAAKVSFHSIKGLSGQDKKDYYLIPEDERLTDGNLVSGTVTISNVGSLYKEQKGHLGLLEIIPPQIFAVGLGAIQEKPGIFMKDNLHKEIGIRKFLPMCLAFDHRAVDFNALTPFLKKLDEIFAWPILIRNW